MATSGTYTYLIDAEDIITEALEFIGVYQAGETLAPADEASVMRTLNLLTKQWMGSADFAPGLKMWTRNDAYLFLQSDQSKYLLGPGPGHSETTLTYYATTLQTASAALDTTLDVADVSDVTSARHVGVVLDDGTLHWSAVSGAPVGNIVTIDTALTGSAAAGNTVFVRHELIARPLEIIHASLRDLSDNDTPLARYDVRQYESIVQKSAASTPTAYYFEPDLTHSQFYIDCTPSDVTKIVRLKVIYPTEDYTSLADDIAYPQVWFAPLAMGLAKRVAPKFGVVWRPDLESSYAEALSIARNTNQDTSSLYFMPGLE